MSRASCAIEIALVDFHVRIEIPLIASLGAGFGVGFVLPPLRGFGVGQVRIEVAAGEDNALAIGSEEAAGGAVAAGADELGFAISFSAFRLPPSDLVEPQRVNLVEHVLARHALEDDRAAVWGEVSFARLGEVESDLLDVLQAFAFDRVLGGVAGGRRRVVGQRVVRQAKQQHKLPQRNDGYELVSSRAFVNAGCGVQTFHENLL